MSSSICFTLEQSKILSGNGLTKWTPADLQCHIIYLPHASGRSFRTVVVLMVVKKEPLCKDRKCEIYLT